MVLLGGEYASRFLELACQVTSPTSDYCEERQKCRRQTNEFNKAGIYEEKQGSASKRGGKRFSLIRQGRYSSHGAVLIDKKCSKKRRKAFTTQDLEK